MSTTVTTSTTADMPVTDSRLVQYPLLTDRVQSTFIDFVFVMVLMFIAASLLDKVTNPPDWIRVALFFGLFGVYEPVCTAFSCTLGNYIKGIRVRQAGNHKKRINIAQALLRYVLKVTLGWISFLTIHFNDERKAIHDLFAGSIMIRLKE